MDLLYYPALASVGFAAFFVLAGPALPLVGIRSETGERFGEIDGLRGVLALSVFVHHFFCTVSWRSTGEWSHASPFVLALGSDAVELFFMITGYLFWGKIVASKGSVLWPSLYTKRIFRLLPLYVLVVGAVVFVALATRRFELMVPPTEFANTILKWLLFQQPDINGLAETSLVIAGVNWTLGFEWLFYLSLPVLALGVRLGIDSLPIRVALTLSCMIGLVLLNVFPIQFGPMWYLRSTELVFFGLGAVSYHLSKNPFLQAFFKQRFAGLIPTVVAGIMLVYNNTLFGIFPFIIFLSVSSGSSVFGLLKSRGVRALGTISYSVYLLHGIVIYVLFGFLFPRILSIDLSFGSSALLLSGSGVLVIAISTLSYQFIEKPCYAYGKSLARTTWPNNRKDKGRNDPDGLESR